MCPGLICGLGWGGGASSGLKNGVFSPWWGAGEQVSEGRDLSSLQDRARPSGGCQSWCLSGRTLVTSARVGSLDWGGGQVPRAGGRGTKR